MENTTVVATTETAQPVVTPSIVPVEATPVVDTVKDLSTKISEFKKSKPVTLPSDNQNNFFDYKEIEKITDPTARQFAENAYKSMQSGFTKKTQEIAEQKRSFEQKIAEMQTWTPERIQRELNNPQFIQAAQAVAQVRNPQNSGLTEEQFSALTPEEKAELAQVPTLKNEINQLKQVNFQAIVAQHDARLQVKYPDYNPGQIDTVISELSKMSPLDIREHVYKSMKHDENVAAAYELGKQEARGLTQNKIDAITSNGNTVTNSDNFPVREKGMTDQAWFQTLANFRLAQFKKR